MRWRLAFARLRLCARSVCDITGFGPSTSGRLCCVLILGALVVLGLLVLSLFLNISAALAIILTLCVFVIVVFSGSALMVLGSDEDLVTCRAGLLQKLPEAKSAWQAHREKPRAQRAPQREQLHTAAVEAELPGPGAYDIEVVGESHYQRELERICGGRRDESARVKTTAVLLLEDTNPYDSKAVRVEIDGDPVGYLSRENARQYRKKLQEAGHARIEASCKALIVGGWDRGNGDRGHFGVRLDLPTEE